VYYAIRILVFSALVTTARAEVVFDILVEDMVDNVLCFDPATCGPVEGHALVTNLVNQMEYTIPIECSGPDGFPMAYQFVMHGDGLLPQGGNMITYLAVDWSGPGFRYRYSETYGPFEFFYSEGPVPPPFEPNTVHPGTGCICTPSAGWEWSACEEGPIQLDSDFVVPAGVVLEIEAGTRVQASPGVRIRVEGAMVTRGSRESWILFEGDDWGGIEFAPGATGELYYTRITGALDSTDGGALGLEPGSEVSLDHCILDHNTTQLRGGAAFVSGESQLSLRSCTVSHNTAGNGGNLYVETGGFVSGYYNLVTFGTPQTMVSEEGPLASNLNFSNVYPLEDPAQGTGWYCDPGYADAALGDFHLAFWSPDSALARNCTIDVSVIPEDTDPDGTRTDMGALPVDQHGILWPASRLIVEDRPDDHGGLVSLGFDASPNDGTDLNPVSFYTVWMRYPGSDEFISSGQTVGAIGLERYTIPVATLRDSSSANWQTPDEFLHTFRVHAHSSRNPDQVVPSGEVAGYSIGNMELGPITGLETDPLWNCDAENGMVSLGIRWDPVAPLGQVGYRLYGQRTHDFRLPVLIHGGPETEYLHMFAYPATMGFSIAYSLMAFDSTGNESLTARLESPVIDCATDVALPADLRLLDVYPNPFNPATRVSFDLQAAQQVRIGLYDMNGRLVHTVFEGGCPAGRHEVVVDGSRLASGVYFLRLETGTHVQIRKLLLLK